MTKDEILKLHTLGEEEQYKWLNDNDIRIYTEVLSMPRFKRWESLADCAFRLRDEAENHEQYYNNLRELLQDSEGVCVGFDVAFVTYVEMIQAALLAKSERTGQ